MIHRHHRKRRSQGGDDSPTNVIAIPDELHNWIHANPEKAYQLGLLVRSTDDPAEIEITLPPDLVQMKKTRAKVERKPAPPRNRATIGIHVPKDEREDGAGILDDLVQMARDQLCEAMGWEDDVPPYFVLVAVLHDWLNTDRQDDGAA